MKPHPNNFCSGRFADWLEVMLWPECNGSCEWCVEKGGYHPENHASWREIADKALATQRRNIVLLGGEPTLYPDLDKIINSLAGVRNLYITTNGSLLTKEFVQNKMLFTLAGINISIHHYDMDRNKAITGIFLEIDILKDAIVKLREHNVNVRFNCNLIKGEIDSRDSIYKYIEFARNMGANDIRLAELRGANGEFVDLAVVFDHDFGLNDEPFTQGCNREATINGMKVSLRQMCGLQNSYRPKPIDPEQITSDHVLYYDGNLYEGWQRTKEIQMKYKKKTFTTVELMRQVAEGKISPEEAAKVVDDSIASVEDTFLGDAGCQY